jgi:hypothetical protein
MPAQIRVFTKNILQVGLLTMVIIGLAFLAIQPDPEHYFSGSLLQVELLKNTPGPRILLVGGSNVALGLDAELMQQTLGIPVINDGLHAGLGVVPLRELQDYIRAGDVIIVSLEYSMFSNPDTMRGDSAFLADWIEFAPRRTAYLFDPWKNAPGIYAIMLQRKVNRQLDIFLHGGSLEETRAIFEGESFDANGDFIGHLQEGVEPTSKIPDTGYPLVRLTDDIFVFLTDFQQFARTRGATVYFEAPASRYSNCLATGKARMENFLITFEQKSSIPVLTSLDEVCMPDKYFFDTPYHLNAQGRELRTKRLIENLLKFNIPSR